jgi:hypothetical protein
MTRTQIEIPNADLSGRVAIVTTWEPEAFSKPYSPVAVLAISLYNSNARGTIDDCLRLAKASAMHLGALGHCVSEIVP